MMVEPSVPPRVEWVSRFLLGGIFSPPKQTTHPTAYCQNIIRSVSPPFLPASCHNPPKRQHRIDKKAAAAPRYSRIFFLLSHQHHGEPGQFRDRFAAVSSPQVNLFGGNSLMEDAGKSLQVVGAEGGLKDPTDSFAPVSSCFASSSSSSSQPRRAELLVGVLTLAKDQFGIGFCGGPIGKDKSKVCVKADCAVSAHKAPKGPSPFDNISGEDSLVCIEVPSSLPMKKGIAIIPTAVFACPTLALSAIPPTQRSEILLDQNPWMDG
jgi:hypothetical protein